MAALAAVTAFTTLFVVAGTAGPAAAAAGNGCPTNKVVAGLPTATNVGGIVLDRCQHDDLHVLLADEREPE